MCYRTFKSKRRTLRESAFRTLFRRDESVEVRALDGVTFNLGRGDGLGIIGNNGAGKSTLCLILSRIMEPTGGVLEVSGCVSALLALGAGFDTDLTGQDNITLNAVYMGYQLDEVREKYDDIVAFSGLGDAIRMPVRTYSSGMRARLAFSIAQSIQPEILIIDEPSSGLDPLTARRLDDLILELRDSLGTTIVVVTHELASILSIGSNSVFLDAETHTMIATGNPQQAAQAGDVKVRHFLSRGAI